MTNRFSSVLRALDMRMRGDYARVILADNDVLCTRYVYQRLAVI